MHFRRARPRGAARLKSTALRSRTSEGPATHRNNSPTRQSPQPATAHRTPAASFCPPVQPLRAAACLQGPHPPQAQQPLLARRRVPLFLGIRKEAGTSFELFT